MNLKPPEAYDFYLEEAHILDAFLDWLKSENLLIGKDTMLAGPTPELRVNKEIICDYLGIEYEPEVSPSSIIPKVEGTDWKRNIF